MKRLLITMVFMFMMCQPMLSQNSPSPSSSKIDLSSVDYFFKMAKELSADKEPTETEWKELSETGGYNKAIATSLRRQIYPKMLRYAFDESYEQQKDSIMNISYNDPDSKKTFCKMTLENYLKVKNSLSKIEAFRAAYDFASLKTLATAKLKSFLKNPADSLIYFPPIYFRFFECDAQVSDGVMTVDFNLFYLLSPDERVGLLSHEMFHFYRSHFENNEFLEANPFFQQIDKLENEGIADILNKEEGLKGGTNSFRYFSDSPIFVDKYTAAYNNTPQILKKLDSITVAYANGKLDKESFDSSLDNYFIYGGHPNGHCMVDMITKAGLKNELLQNFYSPIEFIKIYNKAAKKEDGYVFSNSFISYLNKLNKELLASSKVYFPMIKSQKKLFEMIKTKGTDYALNYYNSERTKGSSKRLFTESAMNSLGYSYLSKGDNSSAITLFGMNVDSYPNSANAYDSLGEAYLAAGNKEQAKINYKKSLELNPGNDNAKKVLSTL